MADRTVAPHQDSQLRTSVVQSQEDSFVQAGSVEVPGNGLPCPTVQLQFLGVRCVGVGLSQDVPIPVFIKGVLQRVPMGQQALSREQRVAATQELQAGIAQWLRLTHKPTTCFASSKKLSVY